MTLVKDGKVDFIQDHHEGIGTMAMGFYSGRERLGSRQVGFVAKEQGAGGQWMEN